MGSIQPSLITTSVIANNTGSGVSAYINKFAETLMESIGNSWWQTEKALENDLTLAKVTATPEQLKELNKLSTLLNDLNAYTPHVTDGTSPTHIHLWGSPGVDETGLKIFQELGGVIQEITGENPFLKTENSNIEQYNEQEMTVFINMVEKEGYSANDFKNCVRSHSLNLYMGEVVAQIALAYPNSPLTISLYNDFQNLQNITSTSKMLSALKNISALMYELTAG